MIIGLVHAQGQASSFITQGGDYSKISPNNYHFSIFHSCPIRPVDRPARPCATGATYHGGMPSRHMGRNKRKKGG